MSMAVKVKPDVTKGITAQGFYVAGADGKAYGFNNNRTVDRVLGLMDKGLREFKQDPPASIELNSSDLSSSFQRAPSEPVETLRIYSRIRPLPEGCDELNKGIGRDTIWVYPGDLQEIAGKTGKFAMPSAIAKRIARFHLVDNVRGEPDFWSDAQVKRIDVTVTAKGNGAYAFSGPFAMETSDGARGLKGNLEGELKLDPSGEKLVRFKAYAEATAWGAGTYTPKPPEGHFPLVFAIVDVHDELAKVTPPQAALYGDYEYKKP